jgi:hypothetical protein
MSESASFYLAAERRIWQFQLAFGALGTAGACLLAGPPAALGFAAGAAVSALNFLWLKQAVDTLVAKALDGEPTGEAVRRRRRVVWKFLVRYGLLAAAGYVILKYTSWNGRALLAGLFLFVAAILAEICFEIIKGLSGDRNGRA